MRLLCVIPNPSDATSFYRAVGPLSIMRYYLPDFEMVVKPRIDYSDILQVDAVFLQRPHQAHELLCAQLAREHGRPVWVDYDDDLLNVPRANPTHAIYGDKRSIETVKEICVTADVVTTSTETLGKLLSPFNDRIFVLPNSFNDDVFTTQPFRASPRRKVVLWRGSGTHQHDLLMFRKEILDVYRERSEWEWDFVGYNPFFITDEMPTRLSYVPSLQFNRYLNYLLELQPAIQIVPLVNDRFNRAKSNIAWIEGSFGGAALLAPDWDEWHRPGILNYLDPADFKRKLLHLMDSSHEEREQRNNDGWAYIRSNLMLTKTNQDRAAVLGELFRHNLKSKAANLRCVTEARVLDRGRISHTESLYERCLITTPGSQMQDLNDT